MSLFDCDYSYWDFVRTIENERRWVFDGKARKFLAAIRASSKSREHRVKSAQRLCRAQVGCELAYWPGSFDEQYETGVKAEHPLGKDRMIPKREYMKEGGRANPPGFAYLYLATTLETALAEMRPWVGESLTLALFELMKDVKLVLCGAGTKHGGTGLLAKTLSTQKPDDRVWKDISRAFSRPMSRDETPSAYVPTQVLAEAFKAEGFDGVAYPSGLEKGTNVVLFDADLAKPIHCCLYTLRKVSYEFEAAPDYQLYLKKKDGTGQSVYQLHAESPK